jgi:tetratricopeptide (TPR) repeat protein
MTEGTPTASPTRAPGTRPRIELIAAALCLLTAIAYWPLVNFDFVNFDDPVFVSENEHVLKGLTWDGFRWAFQFGHGDYWHPVTWLSLMLNVSIFGPGPGGFHFVNLVLQAADAALLFFLLQRWTGRIWPAAFAAALFAIHPLQVESVAWITERKDVLSMLFFLLTLWAYGARRWEFEDRRSDGGGRTSAVAGQKSDDISSISHLRSPISCLRPLPLAFFTLGLMTKSMLVTTPVLLLLLDYWPLNRSARLRDAGMGPGARWFRLLLEKIPFFLLAAISGFITLHGQQRNLGMTPLPDVPFHHRAANALMACERYLRHLFWPVDLAVHYPNPGNWPPAALAAAIVLVAGLSIAAARLARRHPYLFTGWFWFIISVAPMIGLTPGWRQFMADRFTYLPLIGLFVAISWSAAALAGRWRLPQFAAAGIAGLLLAACLFRTRDQVANWRNSETLFRHALAVTTHNDLACYNLGCALKENPRTKPEAAELFRRAVEINPGYAEAQNNLALELAGRGQFDEAIGHYEIALKINPRYVEAHNNLALALAATGKIDAAIEEYHRALDLAPSAEIYSNLGNALADQGRSAEAIEACRQAIALDPSDGRLHFNLALTLAGIGRIEEGIEEYREAARLAPHSPEVYNNLGNLLERTGRLEEAIKTYQHALQINPQFDQARQNLDHALAVQKTVADPVQQLTEKLRANPESAELHNELGNALCRANRLDDALREFRRAVELNPGDAEARGNAGVVLAFQEKWDEAISEFRTALRLQPNSAVIHNNLGNALESKGLPTNATAEYQEAVRLDPRSPESHFNLGRMYHRLGRTNDAAAEFSEALKLKPDYTEATHALRAIRPGPQP